MKVIIVICLVILSHQKTSANQLRLDNSGKSSLSTEYQARFQQRHCDGVNVSEGNIEGNHKFEKSTNEEPWETFASKCASIIHGLVAALTSAVAPAPGDAMNLELDIKNHIFHHDDRQYNTCKPAGALPDCGNVPSTALAPPGIPVGGEILTYPPDGGLSPPVNSYQGTGAVTLNPGIAYGDDVVQLPQSQSLEGPMGYLPVDASPTPEPTMNTPATHEASCETTTPSFSTGFRNPSYAGPGRGGLPDYDVQNKLIEGSPSYPADVLPLDNWKPYANHQADLISPGSALTDDCSSTSPHLTPGFVTPSSPPPRTLSSNNLAWEKFYNEHPELLSSNSPPKSRSCSPSDNPPWSSSFEWETPSQEVDYLPPPQINADPFNPVASSGPATPVPPVTDRSPSGISQGGQQPYLTPVDNNNSFPEVLPSNNFGTPNASENDCPPGDTYANQQPGFVPPFDGMNGIPNGMPGGNFGLPLGSGNDFVLDNTFPNGQPPYFPPSGGAGGANTIPGDFGEPAAPGTDCPSEDEYPDQQQGYLPPGNAYGGSALPGQYLGGSAGSQAGAPLDNTFPQQPEYPPPLPPPPFGSASPGIIPSDSLVTQTVPVPGFSVDKISQNQQPGLPPPLPFDGSLPNSPVAQNTQGPLTDNLRPYPVQQPGQIPPQPFNGQPSNTIPGQNLGGPMESGTLAGNSWDPNQQPGQFPPQPFNGGFSNDLPGKGTVEPGQSGPLASDNWGPIPNQQLGQLPAQPFNNGLSNNLSGQGTADSEQPAPVGSDDSGPDTNQQLGQFQPQPFNDDSSNAIPEQNLGGPMQSGPIGTDNWSPYPNQQPGGLPPPVNSGSSYPVPGQNLDGPMGSGPLANNNWNPNQQPGQLPPQPFDNGISDNFPGSAEPVQSGPVASNNWDPNQQLGQLQPQPFNDDSSNAIPEQNLGGPMQSGPIGTDNWSPYPNQQPGGLPPPVNSGSSYPVPGQNLDGPVGSGPLANNNWDSNQQPGQLPPQPFDNGISNNFPGSAEPVQSGPVANNNNWAPYPNQQPGSLPPQPFNGGSSNAVPEQNLGGPIESGPPASDNWGPYPNQLPGGLPPSVNGGSSYPVPGQNLDGPMGSDPLGSNKWGPNQQLGQLPPQPFNGDPSNALPGQDLGGPMESGPAGSDNWDPYQNQQLGSSPYSQFNAGPVNNLPGSDFPNPPSSEPDNSLDDNNWGGPSQYQPYSPYGMNSPTNFIPGNNILTSMPEAGMNSGNGQQPPLPPVSEGFSDVPCDSTSSDQTIPDNIATTEPTFNGPSPPEYSNNGYRPGPADSNSGYNPFWNQEPFGANYPAGNMNVEVEEPIIPPGMYKPPALESANQVSEPCSDQMEQAGAPGFSGQDSEQYPDGGGYIPESTAPVPEYITPAYDGVISGYNPGMEYQRPGNYGQGMNAAPNRALSKPIQVPPRYQNGLPQRKPNYYGVPNQGWSPNKLYNQRPQYGQPPAGVDPSAIYIPVDRQQSVMLTDPNQDQDSDEMCSCDDCYYDDIVDQKAFRKTACRDLEEARDELKAIFDKIKKKLKCTQKNKCFSNA